MARTDSLNVLDDNGDEALLAESYGRVIENYQAMSNIARIKAVGSGDASTGSLVFSRFQNATVNTYGTARTAGEGDELLDDQVTVNLSNHKEIVEEISKFDATHYGIGDIMRRRVPNQALRMQAHLDRAGWAKLKTAAAAYDTANSTTHTANVTYPNGTTPNYLGLVEQVVVSLETTQNDYVDGIDRSYIVVALKPSIFSKVQQQLDTVFAYDGSTGLKEVPGYHGYQVVSEKYLPSGTDFIVTVVGALAEPVYSDGYQAPEKIQLSNNYAVSLFFDYGVAALTPDLIYEGEFAEAAAE